MGYFIAFGLVYIGYSLADWGHYILKHEPVSLWWLMSAQGTRLPATSGGWAKGKTLDPTHIGDPITAGSSVADKARAQADALAAALGLPPLPAKGTPTATNPPQRLGGQQQ